MASSFISSRYKDASMTAENDQDILHSNFFPNRELQGKVKTSTVILCLLFQKIQCAQFSGFHTRTTNSRCFYAR